MMLNCTQKEFLALLQAGLWEKEILLSPYGEIDYPAIYTLAEEQSVVGIITAGLERVKDVMVSKDWALQFIGATLQIEQTNKGMNTFVAQLIDGLRKQGIYTLLMKGQGIAQCYEKPLWRSSGDVDLLLSDDNYKKAVKSLKAMATCVDEENVYYKHLGMTIDGWSVELHGTLRSGLWKGIDRVLDNVQCDVINGGSVRSWMNGKTQVFLPGINEDVVFVFSHILQHFFKEGIGLRQICDWCRLLWKYQDKIDRKKLEGTIRKAGVMTEWKVFSTLAVDYLGLAVEAMPLYSDESRWKRKSDKVMSFILETGNFGHNRDYTYRQKHSYLVFKAISLWKHLQDFGRYFIIFPLDSIKVTWRRICVGVAVTVSGRMHE